MADEDFNESDEEGGREEQDVTAPSAEAGPSKPPKRKTEHSHIERRRREKLNACFLALQSMVPACVEEAMDALERKDATKAGRANQQSESRRQKNLDMIKTKLVLEKLCIATHSVGKYH